ncbi:hypothetical protein [Bradyrhizobium sp. USDA 313]
MMKENPDNLQPDPPPADDKKPTPHKDQPAELPEVPCQGFSIGES